MADTFQKMQCQRCPRFRILLPLHFDRKVILREGRRGGCQEQLCIDLRTGRWSVFLLSRLRRPVHT